MKRAVLFIAILVQCVFSVDMWRMDIGGMLKFPIPISNTTLGKEFTPILGGGGNFHFWLFRRFGIGAKVTSDYMTEMDNDIDIVALSPQGMISLRHGFSDKATIVADLLAGASFHFEKDRGTNTAEQYTGPVWGGALALPIQANEFFHIGPYGEITVSHLSSETESTRTEAIVSMGVTVAWMIGEF